jgi:hypothetical protein
MEENKASTHEKLLTLLVALILVALFLKVMFF